MVDQNIYGTAVQWQQGKTEVLCEQPVSLPLSWFYLYDDRLVKPGVKNPKFGKLKFIVWLVDIWRLQVVLIIVTSVHSMCLFHKACAVYTVLFHTITRFVIS